jgi:hypothetical protein
LHRATGFQSQLVEIPFPGIFCDPLLQHESPQGTIGTNVVKTVIMDTGVRHMGCHLLDRFISTQL